MIINLLQENNALGMSVEVNGNAYEHILEAANLPIDKEGFAALVGNWVAKNMHPVFNNMPTTDSLHINCDQAFYQNHEKVIRTITSIFEQTNGYLSKYPAGLADNHTGILFWNVADDIRYGSLYERFKRNQSMHYMDFELGYDRVNRKWSDPTPLITIPAIVDYIEKNKIKKIITVNSYIIDRAIMQYAVHLMVLCRHMGVEWITLNNDPPDLKPPGYIHKALFHQPNMKRFSNLQVLNEYWDNLYGLDVHYGVIPQDYGQKKIKELNPDYKIIILTNSRLESVGPLSGLFQKHFSRLDENNLTDDFQLWYLASRQVVLDANISEAQKLTMNSILHQYYYMGVNFLKYQVINAIKTDREVELYGDVGWKEIAPQFYRGCLMNDAIRDLYKRDNQLFLLVNASISHLDASAPVYDMVRWGLPWINMKPLIELFSLKNEYNTDAEEFDYMINNAHKLDFNMEPYASILADSTDDIINIVNDKPSNGIFAHHMQKQKTLLAEMIDEYLVLKRPFINYMFKELFGMIV